MSKIQDQTWRVTRIKGSRSEYIGQVTARNADDAIKHAIVEHEITNPEHQRRLVAQRVG